MTRAVRPPRPLDPERAWDYALWLLGRRAMSADEVRERLRRRSLPEADAARVVAKLEALQLLDDRAFAEAYVRTRAEGHGRLALRRELRRKGVDDGSIDHALAERDDDDQRRAAVGLLRKQAWRFADAESDDRAKAAGARSRAYGLLARRGFPPEAVEAALEAVLGGSDGDATA